MEVKATSTKQLRIVPSIDDSRRILEIMFFEDMLGLKKEGDSILLVRRNVIGESLSYLETPLHRENSQSSTTQKITLEKTTDSSNSEVIGTCGHKLRDILGNQITLKYHYHDYESVSTKRCITHNNVCDDCAELYEKQGAVLHNESEINDWLNEKYTHSFANVEVKKVESSHD